MSIELDWLMRARVTETISDAYTDTSLDTVRKDGAGVERELDSGTTPDVEDFAMGQITLSSGTGSINLAAIVHTQGSLSITKNATGKKVRAWAFWTPDTNANNITIVQGASNGYAPLGSAFTKVIAPDGESGDYFKGAAADVASGARVLDITGTGTQVVKYAIIWG